VTDQVSHPYQEGGRHVARMADRNIREILVGKPEEKKSLGRTRRRWEDNIKMDLRETEWVRAEWIHLAQDTDQ